MKHYLKILVNDVMYSLSFFYWFWCTSTFLWQKMHIYCMCCCYMINILFNNFTSGMYSTNTRETKTGGVHHWHGIDSAKSMEMYTAATMFASIRCDVTENKAHCIYRIQLLHITSPTNWIKTSCLSNFLLH